MITEEKKSIIYKTSVGKIQVSMFYSNHSKCWVVQGSRYGILECGGSSITSTIKGTIKNYIEKNNLQIKGKITHSIYGMYSVEVQ